jgi:hypothetical protein
MLTEQQLAEFELHGVLSLPETVPADKALEMRDRLWGYLSAMHGRKADDPTTWRPIDGRAGFKTLMRTGAFAEVGDYLVPLVTSLLGPEWERPAHWGHPLVTFPRSDRQWSLPARNWHVDSTQWSNGELPGVVAFTFLDKVRPRGGGTLVMAGSHRVTWALCQRAGGFMRTGEMKATLADEHPWFAELWRSPVGDPEGLGRYLEAGTTVDGNPVRVVELCGRPGDVYLMNQRAFHVTAPNALDTPRMMLSDFLSRRPADEP